MAKKTRIKIDTETMSFEKHDEIFEYLREVPEDLDETGRYHLIHGIAQRCGDATAGMQAKGYTTAEIIKTMNDKLEWINDGCPKRERAVSTEMKEFRVNASQVDSLAELRLLARMGYPMNKAQKDKLEELEAVATKAS